MVGDKAEFGVGVLVPTPRAIELSQEAEKLGMDGLLLVVPYYNKPSQEGLYQHYKTVAASVSIPIMLYNIPSRTGVNMLPETVARLAELENVVALKESTGLMDQMSALKNILPDKMAIYSGDDSQTLPMLSPGGVRCQYRIPSCRSPDQTDDECVCQR